MIRSNRASARHAAIAALGLAACSPATICAAQGLAFPTDQSRGVLSLAPMVAKATPAVVNISVSSTRPGQQNPLLQDPFFRRFFGNGESNPQATPQQRVMAAGSGVIVDAAKGYVVTNNHVVEHADKITVTTKNGRQLDGKLVGRDAETDLALVQVQAHDLTDLAIGNSDSLQVGDVVLAIGNPFGLGQTVTAGIVSALGRSGLNAEHYESFIQTDAPINPGNSGGALIDSKGQLEGINTAIIGPGGGNVGIGFAVPANMVKAVIGQLERNGEVRRGRVGVMIRTVTPGIAEAMRLGQVHGVVVTGVEKGSAAEHAGLKSGDVITAIDDRPVEASAQVRNAVGLKEIGSKVKLTIVRDGKRQDLDVAIEKPQEQANASVTLPKLTGATFATQQSRDGSEQVVVKDVQRSSEAYALGLRAGDVIEAANRKAVHSIADLKTATSAEDGGSLALNIRRGEMEILLFAS